MHGRLLYGNSNACTYCQFFKLKVSSWTRLKAVQVVQEQVRVQVVVQVEQLLSVLGTHVSWGI